MKRGRQYTRDFKIGVIREGESGKTLAQVSRENGISPSLIVKWRKQYFDDPENAFRGNGKIYNINCFNPQNPDKIHFRFYLRNLRVSAITYRYL